MNTVIHIGDAPRGWQDISQYVYIGRKTRSGLPESKWHNPFRMKTEAERGRVIDQFRQYITNQHTLLADLPELSGKILVCYCSPKACHGHVLVELLQNGVE